MKEHERAVRCARCQMPLVQRYQGDAVYTLQIEGEMGIAQRVPAYAYRKPEHSHELVVCPRCGAVLSSATVTAVNPVPVVIIEVEPERFGRRQRGRV